MLLRKTTAVRRGRCQVRGARTQFYWLIPVVLAVCVSLLITACAKPEERSEAHLQKGLQLIAAKNDLDARLELLNAIKYKSDNLAALRALAGVNERTGATSAYVQNLRRIIELDPSDSDSKIRFAKLMLRGNAADAALRMMETVTGQEDSADFHGTKANIFLAVKDAAGALKAAQRAAEIDPSNADAAIILASDRTRQNDNRGALQILDMARVTDPKDTRVGLAKVQILQRSGDLSQAEAELRALVERRPQELSLRLQLVQLLARQRRMDEAEQELRAISAANPSDSKIGLDLVRFIVSSRGAAAGQQELESRIDKGGEVFPYQIALADLAISQRNLPEATNLLTKLASDAKATDQKNTAKVKLAEVKLAQKNLPAAEHLIADVLQSDRRNVAALRLRALLRLDRGQTDSALADLREALNEQPKATELLLLMAQAYERNGQNELAERQFAEAVRSSEYDAAIVLRFVAFLQRQNSAAKAEDILVDAIRRRSQSVELISSLAQVRLSRKNWAGALAIADVLGRNQQTKALEGQIRAAALAGQDKPEESLAALERAHEASPGSLGPIVSLVRAYLAHKSYGKAEKMLEDSLRKFPSSAPLLALLGQVQLAKGAAEDAAKTYQEAIKQQPKDASGHFALANVYGRQKKYDDAIAAVDRGLELIPGDVNLRMAKARWLFAKGDYNEVISIYESVLTDRPNSPAAINNLASMLLDHRNDRASVERGQALVERLKGVDFPEFADTKGWSQHLRGDNELARPLLEQAKAQLPDSATVRFHLGMVYRSLGEEEKAVEEFKSANLLETEETPLKKKIRAALN